MKNLILLFTLLFLGLSVQAQTVENIRVTQDGDQLRITYRIGASTQAQLFRVIMECSMDGAPKFRPESVMGDVGDNIVGGKSIYTIMWDVFGDVDEVINPNITVRVEQMNATPPPVPVSRQVEDEPARVEEQDQEPATEPRVEPEKDTQESTQPAPGEFERDNYFSYSGITGFGVPIGVSFGSLNKWGYYVTPMRMCIYTYDYWDGYGYETDMDLNIFISAGATRNIVGTGLFRLHGYAGAGGHIESRNVATNPYATGHFMMETGVQGVIGGLYLSAGFEYSFGYVYPFNFVYGIGFAF